MSLLCKQEWVIISELVRKRLAFEQFVGAQGLPDWPRFTGDELDRLARRHTAVIAWSARLPLPPTIIFVGVLHKSLVGQMTSAQHALVSRVQETAFKLVLQEMSTATVIAVEQCGSDQPLTAETYTEISQRMIRDFEGAHVSPRKIRRMMETDDQATTRLILLKERPPVICGEEWPLTLASRLLYSLAHLPAGKHRVALELMDALNWLRSELILIRTLEFLRRAGGTKGIILQGNGHGVHLQALAGIYHISLTNIAPDLQP